MIRRLVAATALVMRVQVRGYFPHAFALYVAMVVGVMLVLLPSSAAAIVLPVFLVTEPGMLGVMAVAAQRYLDVGSGSVLALQVSPLRSVEYLLALTLASALLGTLAGLVTFAAVAGPDARLVGLGALLFVFALLSGLLGFALSLRSADFPRFLLGSIPVLLFWQAPLLAVYEVVPVPAVAWLPSAPGILGIAALCRDAASPGLLLTCFAASLAWTLVGLVLVTRRVEQRLGAGWEAA